MINIWDYADYNEIKITDIDGQVFQGKVVDVTDEGERSDLEEKEDGITINCNGIHIEFMQSEIKNIEIIS